MAIRRKIKGKSSKGAALVEYGMVAGLIGLLAIVGVASTGKEVYHVFCVAANSLGEKVYEVRGEEFVPLKGCEDIYAEGDPLNNPTELPTDGSGVAAFREETTFDDVIFPAGTVGEQLVLYPYTSLVPDQSEAVLGVGSGGVVARACYQMVTDGRAICSAASQNPTTDVPAGAVQVGYWVDLPQNVGEGFAYDFELTADVSGPGDATSGTFEVSRVTDISGYLATIVFPDVVFPMYSTGLNESFFDAELFSEIDQEVRFEIEPRGGVDHSSCVMASGGSFNCNSVGAHATDDDRILNPVEGETGGLIANLPSDPRLPYSHTVDIRLTSVDDPNVTRLYTGVNVSRVASAVLMDFSGMSFPDYTVDAGTIGYEYFMTELVGGFGGDLRLFVDEEYGYNVSNLSQCRQATELSSIGCNSNAYYTVPDTTYGVGFRFSLPSSEQSLYTDYTQKFKFTMSSDIDPSVFHRFNNITVTRPALPSVVNASTTFPNTVIAATSNSTTIYRPLQGTFTGNMSWGVVPTANTVPGTISYAACYNNGCGVQKTSGISYDQTSRTGDIGYKVNFPNAVPGNFEQHVELQMVLTSVYDNTQTQTFTTRVTREALPIVFNPTFIFEDKTLASNFYGTVDGMISKTGSFNDAFRVSVRMTDKSSNWSPYIRACGGSTTATSQCGSNVTTMNGWAYDGVAESHGYVGYKLGMYAADAPQAGEGDYWVDLDIRLESGVYAEDPTQYETRLWSIRITRPGI